MVLNLVSCNVNGIRGKFDRISIFVATYIPYILAIQETKLSSVSLANLSLPEYALFRKDRNENGGGICLYILDKLKPQLVECSLSSQFEILLVSFKTSGKLYCVINCYKSPKVRGNDYIACLQDIIASLQPKYDGILISGNFNLCFSREYDFFIPILDTFDITQHVNSATHKNRIIDLFFCTNDLCCKVVLLPGFESDHSAISVEIDIRSDHKTFSDEDSFLKWNQADFNLISNAILTANLPKMVKEADSVNAA
jgi:hypothetical protein